MEDPAQLSQKIKACEDALKASKDLLGFFSDYRKAIESARDDPSTWDRERIVYHNKRVALVADFKEKLKAAYDC